MNAETTSAASRLGRAVAGAALVFALGDLWQIAVLNPRTLSPVGVLALLGLYAGGAVLGAVLLRAVATVSAVASRLAPAALLLACGFLLVRELMPIAFASYSPSVWAVTALALPVALLAAGVARLGQTRRGFGWTMAAGVAALVIASVGAVHGLSPSLRSGPAAGRPPGSEGALPNIVLITIDTLRADHLSCYGYGRATSPVIDALAREGVLFTRAFAQSSWTKPSTASLLTARYPSTHGAYLEKAALPASEVLLPEVLHDHGYATAVFSANRLIRPEFGFDQGVDEFHGVDSEGFAHATLVMNALKRANKLVDNRASLYRRIKWLVLGHVSPTQRDRALNALALRWLERHHTQPFFAYLHYISPHEPHTAPAPFGTKFVLEPRRPAVTTYPRKTFHFFERGTPLAEDARQDLIAHYDGGIAFADGMLGELLGALGRHGVLERTIVVITSDHGEEFFEHGNWGHGHSVRNVLTHVPLLMRYPAALPAGVRVAEPVMSVDAMPTVLALAGIPAGGAEIAGRNLLPLLRGEPIAGRGQAYSELLYRYGSSRALVRGRKKMVETTEAGRTEWALYDLASDFPEQRDLLAMSPGGLAHVRRVWQAYAGAPPGVRLSAASHQRP